MKRRLRKDFITADISFDDFMSHPDALAKTEKSVTEMVLEAKTAEEETKKRDRELKAVKRREKREKRTP